MANYCTANDIKVLIGLPSNFVFSDADPKTRPTLTEINALIEEKTNIIDFYLTSIGITEQPTDLKILAKLKQCCKWGVAAGAGYGSPQQNNRGDSTPQTYQELFDNCLKEIIENPSLFTQIVDSDSIFSDYNEDNDNTLLLDPDYAT